MTHAAFKCIDILLVMIKYHAVKLYSTCGIVVPKSSLNYTQYWYRQKMALRCSGNIVVPPNTATNYT